MKPPAGALPKFGLKPVEPDVLVELPPKVGLNPVEADVLVELPPKLGLKPEEVSEPLVVGAEGVKTKPVVGAAGFEGSVAGFSAVFGAKRLVDDVAAGVEGLLPIAFANMLDVAVAGALSFGVESDS
jgi:hypothetical protein